MKTKKIKLALACIILAISGFSQNLIQNPEFENGPTITSPGLPPGFCPDWEYGCQLQSIGSNNCSPDIYDLNGYKSCWVADVLLPRQNGSTNHRYIHMFPGLTPETGESIKGDINQPLSTAHSYEVSCYVSRKWNNLIPSADELWQQNPNLQLEFVLRKDNDCSIEKIVHTSSSITNFFYANNGCPSAPQSNNWVQKLGYFNLSQADVNIGYNKLEIRIKGIGHVIHPVFIDDVSLKEIDKVGAAFHFTNPGQTQGTFSSIYGPVPITYICATPPETCVTIDGSASQNETGYYITIEPWNSTNGNWSAAGPALFDGWVCTNCTAGPKNLCDLTNLNGTSFQTNTIYKVRLAVGPIWDEVSHFIMIRPTPQISPVPDQNICFGASATFNITTTNWPVQVYNGANLVGTYFSNPIILSPPSTTAYSFVAENKYGCEDVQTAMVDVRECPISCFEFIEPLGIDTVDTRYGPMPIVEYCWPAEAFIDGSCSMFEDGYHIRVSEIDVQNWVLNPDLYNGWVSASGQVPSSTNLNALVSPNNFVLNQIYYIGLTVGPGWNTGTGQLFRFVDDCGAKSGERRSTSIPNMTNTNVYPNPTNGEVMIQFDRVVSGTLTVFSIDGQLLNTLEFNAVSQLKTDLSQFDKGSYIININTSSETFIKTIIKN